MTFETKLAFAFVLFAACALINATITEQHLDSFTTYEKSVNPLEGTDDDTTNNKDTCSRAKKALGIASTVKSGVCLFPPARRYCQQLKMLHASLQEIEKHVCN